MKIKCPVARRRPGWGLSMVMPAFVGTAHAHGEAPRVVAIEHPAALSKATALLITDTQGLFTLGTAPAPARWLCEDAVGPSAGLNGALVGPEPGTWLVSGSTGLLRSTDAGCSFAPVVGLPAEAVPVGLTAHPERPVERAVGASAAAVGLFFSEDAGATWHPADAPGATSIRSLVRMSAAPDRLYAAGPEGLFRSEDGGRRYVRVAAGGALAGVDPASAYALAGGGPAGRPGRGLGGGSACAGHPAAAQPRPGRDVRARPHPARPDRESRLRRRGGARGRRHALRDAFALRPRPHRVRRRPGARARIRVSRSRPHRCGRCALGLRRRVSGGTVHRGDESGLRGDLDARPDRPVRGRAALRLPRGHAGGARLCRRLPRPAGRGHLRSRDGRRDVARRARRRPGREPRPRMRRTARAGTRARPRTRRSSAPLRARRFAKAPAPPRDTNPRPPASSCSYCWGWSRARRSTRARPTNTLFSTTDRTLP
jgi:hypothetical protein